MNRYRRFIAAGAMAATAAVAVGIWTSTPDSPDPARVIVTKHLQNSVDYINDQAQGWSTCPAAASTCIRWKMDEAAGNITDDLSGSNYVLTAGGAPIYSVHTPIVQQDGFTRDAIAFDDNADFFVAADNAVGQQTTNDFTISAWFKYIPNASSALPRLIEKTLAALSYSLYYDEAAATFLLTTNDGGGVKTCRSVAVVINDSGHHRLDVAVDRDTTVHFYMDDVEIGTGACNIAVGSIASATNIVIGNRAGVDRAWEGDLHDVMIADGLMTLAEHQAIYRAFQVPSDVTYGQTTSWKWPCGTDSGGERLCTIAGHATNPQWPVAISSTAIDAAKNPLGTEFPGHDAISNVIGFPNEFESWALGGGMVGGDIFTNAGESPDGSIIAERVTFNIGETLTRTVVGGGNIVAGEIWGASIWYRFVSGAGCAIRVYNGTTEFETLSTADTEWHKLPVLSRQAGEAKQIQFNANAAINCIFDLADAQYTENNVYAGQCTTCTGAVNCGCNASYYQLDWTNTADAYAALERGEVEVSVVAAPQVHADTHPRTIWQMGNHASLIEGVRPAFILRGHSGSTEVLVEGKPLQIDAEHRTYTASWNTRNQLNLGRNASLRMEQNRSGNSYHQHQVLDARRHADRIDIDPHPEAFKEDLNARVITVGCDSNGTNCANAWIENFTLYNRPTEGPVAADPTFLLSTTSTGPAYLEAAATPRFNCFGASSDNCWIWDMGDYGGGQIIDRINGIVSVENGSPEYQVFSGLLARGQGRRGVHSSNGDMHYIAAADAAIADQTINNFSVSFVLSYNGVASAANGYIFDKVPAALNAGYHCFVAFPAGDLHCAIVTMTGAVSGAVSDFVIPVDGSWHTYTINYDRASTISAVIDGEVQVATVDISAKVGQTLTSPQVLHLFRYSNAANFDSIATYGELLFTDGLTTVAQAISYYKQTTQQGTYWNNDSNTVAHYKLNESSIDNGVGIKDSSGNGNHLTVVAGTPDPQYRDMPWPAGSGVVKPAIDYPSTGDYHSGAIPATATGEPYTAVLWVRHEGDVTGWKYIARGRIGGVQAWHCFIHSLNKKLYCNVYDTGNNSSNTNTNMTLDDSNWHLIALKPIQEGAQVKVNISVDGAPFVYTAGTTTAVWANMRGTNQVQAGYITGAGGSAVDMSSFAFLHNYQMTDADIASLFKLGTSPIPNLTYARTSTGAKGMCTETYLDPVLGIRVTCWGDNQVPYAQHADLAGYPGNERMWLGLPIQSALLNEILVYSEALDTWSKSNIVVLADDDIAPDGTKTADKLFEAAVDSHHTIYAGESALAKVAQNDYATMSSFVKYGNGTPWMSITIADPATGNYCHCNFNTATGVIGNSGCVGGAYANASCKVIGLGTGWFRGFVNAQCIKVGGCRAWSPLRLLNADTVNGAAIYLGDVSYYIYAWGAQWHNAGSTTGWFRRVYCPNSGATQTCNAPTNAYVAAANLASWDRSQGIIVSSIWPTSTGGYAFDLHNGANLNGAIRFTSPTTRAYIYNSTGGLEQDWGLINAQISTPLGAMLIFDSSAQIDGARYVHGRNYSASYAGVFDTHTVDTGAWIPLGATNLHLGMDNAGGNLIDGYHAGVSIWKAR